jgi:hypothetical protein
VKAENIKYVQYYDTVAVDAEHQSVHSAENHDANVIITTHNAESAQPVRWIDELFSRYNGEEELIVRAVRYDMPATETELSTKVFDLPKCSATTGENILHACLNQLVRGQHVSDNLHTFELIAKLWKQRLISNTMSHAQIQQFVWGSENTINFEDSEMKLEKPNVKMSMHLLCDELSADYPLIVKELNSWNETRETKC